MLCCLVFLVMIFVCSADDHSQFFKPQKLIVQEGSYFQLPCAPEGSEEILHFFTWNKNHELIVDKMTNTSSRFEIQSDFSLLVENVEESDRGIYSCNVQSDPPRLTWYEVEVEVPAQVDTVPETGFLTLSLHEDAELTCRVKGRPLPVVTWYFGGKKAHQQFVMEEKTSNTSLVSRIILPDVSRHESGYYTCIADNSLSKEIGNFSLTVIYPPEILVDQTWVHAGLGIRAELACQVYGEPKPEVAWFFEGKPIEASNRAAMILRDERHSLVLKNIRDGDLGNYSCRARSELGETEKTIVVSGLPGPAVVRAELPREGTGKKEEDTSSGQSYTLLWTVASHSPLYEYKFSLRPYGGDSQDSKEWIIPAEQTSSNSFLHSQAYVLRGLEPGKAYQVTLQSRNRFGWSQQSDALILHAGGINDDENNVVGASNSPSTTTSSTLSTEMMSIFPTEPVFATSTLPEATTPTSAPPTTLASTTTNVMSHVTEEPVLVPGHEDENELEEEKEYEDYIKETKPETEITLEEDMNAILEQEQLIEEEQQEALENAGVGNDDYVLPLVIDPIIIDTTTTETPVVDTTTTAGTFPTTTVTTTTVPTTTMISAATNIPSVSTVAIAEQTVPASSSQLPAVEVSIENKIVVNHRNPSEMGLRSASSAAAPALCFYLLFLWFLVSRFL